MKILLDHCVPQPFKYALAEHEVSTAKEMNWEALKNGNLLQQASANGFELFITVDRNLQHQQNLSGLSVAVCTMISTGITIEELRPLVGILDKLLPMIQAGKYYQIAWSGDGLDAFGEA